MSALRGLDTPSELTRHAAGLRAQGFDFVVRYYSHNAASNLSLGEARALSAAGLLLGVVWEGAGTHAGFFNRAQGVADGAAAFRAARLAIGQPAGSAIYFPVGYDATDADIEGPVSDYFSGVKMAFAAAADGLSPYGVGVLGSGLCCDTLIDKHLATLGWLSQPSGFAGSKAYAESARYNMIQRLPARASVGDGSEELSFGPDWTNPGRPHGLFRLTSF